MNPILFGALLSAAVNVFAPYRDMEKNWLNLMAPRPGSESLYRVETASNRAQSTAEEFAHSMDIALGAQVAPPYLSGSAREVPPKARYAHAGGISS